MYLFPVLALPLGFVLLYMSAYPEEERPTCRREVLRGLVLSPLVWILSGLVGSLMPDFPGSPLLILSDWADRSLPLAGLPLLGYALFHRLDERMPAGAAERRMAAFFAGSLMPIGVAEAARSWASPDLYLVVLLPVLTASMALVVGPAASGIAYEYGWRRAPRILALVLATMAAAAPRWLLLSGLWPLALLLTALIAFLSWLYAGQGLTRRQAAPAAA